MQRAQSEAAMTGQSPRSEIRIEKPHVMSAGLSTCIFDILLMALHGSPSRPPSSFFEKWVAQWSSF